MSATGFDDMLAGLPGAHGVLVPNSSHQLHLEQPAAVAGELERFVADVVDAG